jgi:hypothetical protein
MTFFLRSGRLRVIAFAMTVSETNSSYGRSSDAVNVLKLIPYKHPHAWNGRTCEPIQEELPALGELPN